LELISADLDARQRDGVLKTLRRFRETVRAIKGGESLQPTALPALRRFLERLSESSLDQVDDRSMPSEAVGTQRQSLVEWRKTSRD
jgi:hypothetical protein